MMGIWDKKREGKLFLSVIFGREHKPKNEKRKNVILLDLLI